ncbi:MAG TPA: c-type cytochrome, partial [Candidatus Nitrosopolaris sp.]|nr:c-type cytochrome [Candidatus Nitrosopolaris sp.]
MQGSAEIPADTFPGKLDCIGGRCPTRREKFSTRKERAMQLTARMLPGILCFAVLGAGNNATVQPQAAGDAKRGQTYFLQTCALCHSANLGPGNTVIVRQGPSLVGVVGRRAGGGVGFTYTKALSGSGLTWDTATLDKFLASPTTIVPGTAMLIPVPNPDDRRNLIAYLSTLALLAGVTPTAAVMPATRIPPGIDPGDWRNAAPGVKHHITVADLPPPYSTASAGNAPRVVEPPPDATLSVPPGFTVRLFASGLSGPRLLRKAPNGDIFISETRENRLRVLRAADGAETPSVNRIFASGLDRPFGIGFYPLGNDPQWIYV